MIPKPPKLEDLPYGTKLHAGMGETTILADLDFETYSEAGFIWNEATNKFDAPPNANRKGLPVIGAAVYSEHPSTEVLSCAYDLKDGKGKRLWKPGLPNPKDLFRHIEDGFLLEAWNVMFERWIWLNVCMKKYGWPYVPMRLWRCAAAKSVAHALPKSLDPAGTVLNIEHKKHKDGMRLLNKFSMPRNPTKSNPQKRIYVIDDPEDAKNLYAYNLQDIAAEAELSSLIPDLIPSELEFWQCDQAINFRGVMMDHKTILNAIKIIEQAHKKYNDELCTLTGGVASKASEIAKIRLWMHGQGVVAHTLDDDKITELLATKLPIPVRRVLEIRQLIGSAAVKKLYAMHNQITKSGRIHDLFLFHSARTGRAAGVGVQPQNMPNSGLSVDRCDICHRYSFNYDSCPWCSKHVDALQSVEWNPKAVEDAILTINTGSLACVEYHFYNAIAAVSGCLRGMFISSPGHDLICSDYSAIEAVVLAELAGEKWRQEVFRTHGKIYELSASKITGIPFDDFIKHKQETGQHHPMRKKVGKIAELACFSRNTQVLTKRGYVRITAVLLTDQLWDGLKWVNHQGVVKKGKKKVITVDGVKMTPSHPICINGSWKEAKQLVLSENILYQALATASEKLPLQAKQSNKKYLSNVHVPKISTLYRFQTYIREKLHDVRNVLKRNLKLLMSNCIRNTHTLCLMPNTEGGLLIDYERPLQDAILQVTNNTLIMVDAGYTSVKNGRKTPLVFYPTLSRLTAGIIPLLIWIGSIVIKAISPIIFDSLLDRKIRLIKEAFEKCKKKLSFSKTVYDIVNAGSLNRFTIKTKSGHLIVHNSGYQGWIGAWKAFGADAYFTDEEIKKNILAWRDASPAIVEYWGGQKRNWKPEYYGIEGAAIEAIIYPGDIINYKGICFQTRANVLYCRLLSGRYLTYHRPKLIPSLRPGREDTLSLSFEGWNSNANYGAPSWMRIETWGGRLVENIVQAVSRDILAHAIVNLEKSGYPVVLHVHDEIVSEVPEGFGSVDEFEKIMSTMPAWASGWPVKANGGWRAKRYSK